MQEKRDGTMTPSLPSSFFTSSWDIPPTRIPELVDSIMTVVVVDDSSQEKKKSIIAMGKYREKNPRLPGSRYRIRMIPFCGIFDVSTQTWDTLPPVITESMNAAAVCHRGTVYVMGGYQRDYLRSVVSLDVQHPSNSSLCWRELPCMISARMDFGAALVKDMNKIIVVGGSGDGGLLTGRQSAEVFDLENMTWAPLPMSMPSGRAGCCVACVDQTVYVFGQRKSVEAFHVVSETWELLPNMPRFRLNGAAVTVGTYILLIGGGGVNGGLVERIDCFDTIARQWIEDDGAIPPLNTPRRGCAAERVGNQVYVLGGRGRDELLVDTMEVIHVNPFHMIRPRLLQLLKQNDELPLGLWPHMLADVPPSIVFSILCSSRFKLDAVLIHSRHSRGTKRKANSKPE